VKSFWETTTFAGGTFESTAVDGGRLVLTGIGHLTGLETTKKYNGNRYYYGRFTAPSQAVTFTEAIASWQANTPTGTWIEVELRAQMGDMWSRWYSMGVWLESDTPFQRHSVAGQGDQMGTVSADTLALARAAHRVQVRVTLFTINSAVTPSVRGLGATFSDRIDAAGVVASTGVNSDLAVPKQSQMVIADRGEVLCSPTAISMVMAFWAGLTGNSALNQPVPTVANGVWDYAYDGAGNWSFNTAYAASFGLISQVVRLGSLAEVERWTAAGVPVIASIAYQQGALQNSPIPSTAGHLLVIRGFDALGNVLTNDPAASSEAAVAITYDRLAFEQAWLAKSNGTVYLTYPADWTIPAHS
jgi:hypothetical protein